LDTWERAKRQREQPFFKLLQNLSTQPLERCTSDPARLKAHPATLLEIALLSLSKEDFYSVQPDHTKQIKPDTPIQTGVKWIDEMEMKLFSSEDVKDGTRN
jgi:hypothetical protein